MRDELRATLHELEIEHGHSSDHEAVWPVCARRHAVMDAARAALLADTPSVEPAGLDVERLARALADDGNNDPEMFDLLSEPGRDIWRKQARRVADRLSLLPTQASDSKETTT